MRLLLSIVLFALVGCTCSTPAEGQKIGRIVKLAHEGLFNKTCEGELIRGGINDGTGSMGTSFHFTIEDPTNMYLAKQAMENQDEVTLYYRTEFITSISRSESSHPHFVTLISIHD